MAGNGCNTYKESHRPALDISGLRATNMGPLRGSKGLLMQKVQKYPQTWSPLSIPLRGRYLGVLCYERISEYGSSLEWHSSGARVGLE